MAFAHGGVVITAATLSPGATDNKQKINTYQNTQAHTQAHEPRCIWEDLINCSS